MTIDPHSDAGDVIISADSSGTLVLSGSGGTPRIVCRTVEELLNRLAPVGDRHAPIWCQADDRTLTPVDDPVLLTRMWAEFAEMPGLSLTAAQARRLWGVDADTCLSSLDTLVALKALTRSPDGTYRRAAMTASRHLLHAS